jgi:hypothetical protein
MLHFRLRHLKLVTQPIQLQLPRHNWKHKAFAEPRVSECGIGLQVLTAVDRKNYIFLDITPCNLLKASQRFVSASYLLYAGFFLCSFFDPEDRGDMLLRNVG